MNPLDRRTLFRIAAPAVALPMLATPLQAKEVRLVTREEIMDAFRFYDHMELSAEDLNLRYHLLIDMLFETNPEHLRETLQVLRDNRRGRSVLVDACSGQTAPFDPSMYDEMGHLIQRELAPLQARLADASKLDVVDAVQHALPHMPPPRWHRRIARFVRKLAIGV
jgi:hypothetical protein